MSESSLVENKKAGRRVPGVPWRLDNRGRVAESLPALQQTLIGERLDERYGPRHGSTELVDRLPRVEEVQHHGHERRAGNAR